MQEILSEAFELRLDSDYEDFYVATKEEALDQINNAEFFLGRVVNFIRDFYRIDI